MRRKRIPCGLLPLVVSLLCVYAAGCTAAGSGNLVNNPLPLITSTSPSTIAVGGAGFALTVFGGNFVSGAIVQWNGSNRTTTFISSTQLTAAILAADVAATGTAQVTVVNPAPGGGSSNALAFAINNPVPTAASLSPSSTLVGGAAFNLTVNGTSFVSSSTVRWNGSSRTTTFVSSTQLTAAILAADIAATGTAQVTVVNPVPGGGASNALTFTINNPVPAVASLLPPNATAGGVSFSLTVNGANFVSGAVVQWNGSNRNSTFVNSTQMTAAIPASDILAAGAAQVSVLNPGPGGGPSNALAFPINPLTSNPVPVLVSISPSGIAAELSGFTLLVNGSDFVGGSVAQWNGSARATTVLAVNQLQFAPLPGDTASAGTAQITVSNPSPGGGVSNSLNFQVSALPPGAVGVTDRLSVTINSTESNGDSISPAVTPDGRFIAFSSSATNLVAGDTNAVGDVFVRDTCRGAAPGCVPSTTRVSVANDGSQSNNDSFSPSISADGRLVAFSSSATNLVTGDTNGAIDVFVRDTCVGATGCTPSTIRASVANSGGQSNSDSFNPRITADGRFIAFDSFADNLVSGDTNGASDVFVRDTCFGATGCTPATSRVSVANDGSQASLNSFGPSISANGRLVAFQSSAANLVTGDTNGSDDIFVRDTCAGASGCTTSTTRVSVGTSGTQGDNTSFLPTISSTGRFVVFTSFAGNLVPNDTNFGHDVFVRDTCFGGSGSCTPSTSRVSVDTSGNQADAPSGGPATGGASISSDGRFVSFGSRATNLVVGDTNGTFDVFVRDTCTGATGCTPSTFRVSVALDGTQSVDRSDLPVITPDGRFVVFVSFSDKFLPGDTNLAVDVFFARTGKP